MGRWKKEKRETYVIPGHHDGRDTKNRSDHVNADEQERYRYVAVVDSDQEDVPEECPSGACLDMPVALTKLVREVALGDNDDRGNDPDGCAHVVGVRGRVSVFLENDGELLEDTHAELHTGKDQDKQVDIRGDEQVA